MKQFHLSSVYTGESLVIFFFLPHLICFSPLGFWSRGPREWYIWYGVKEIVPLGYNNTSPARRKPWGGSQVLLNTGCSGPCRSKRQQVPKFRVVLGYIVSLRQDWATWNSVSKPKTNAFILKSNLNFYQWLLCYTCFLGWQPRVSSCPSHIGTPCVVMILSITQQNRHVYC